MSEKTGNDVSQKNAAGVPYVSSVQNNRTRILLVAVGLVLAAILVVGIVWGWLYLGLKNPEQKVQVAYKVCGDEIVQTFEEDIYFPLDEKNSQAANQLIKTITSKSKYADDPTCQTILFWLAEAKGDKNTMENSLKAIKQMHQKGIYANTALQNSALNYLEDAMAWIDEDKVNNEE